jgi:hypothetical protein
MPSPACQARSACDPGCLRSGAGRVGGRPAGPSRLETGELRRRGGGGGELLHPRRRGTGLLVSLKREGTEANPVIVDVTYRRIGNGDHPSGVYNGEVDGFGWVLYKNAEANWVQDTLNVAGKFIDLVNGVIGMVPEAASWQEYTVAAGAVVHKLQGFDPPGSSDNSQVDNISSVLFGTREG